jgi:hypothetical protein
MEISAEEVVEKDEMGKQNDDKGKAMVFKVSVSTVIFE